MLIFIKNTPRAYAWGSRDALPDLLGLEPNGDPQAELWLGAHPGAPATVAKANGGEPELDLIGLIASDPERYGVNGGQLPFLLKVLAIGGPLSLQVHPNKAQAEAGFAAEEAAGVAADDPTRNYGDPNHKPELLVALSDVVALSGFRPLVDARHDLRVLAELVEAQVAEQSHGGAGAALSLMAAQGMRHAADLCEVQGEGDEARVSRTEFLRWALAGGEDAVAASAAIAAVLGDGDPLDGRLEALDQVRLWSLKRLTETYPGDTGLLISLLLHVVRLAPGMAIYLGAQQLHAYLDGVAVEIMAASDNVLRAGFTPKHIDVPEVLRIVDPGLLGTPLIEPSRETAGMLRWQPDVPDFSLMRVRVREPEGEEPFGDLDNSAGEHVQLEGAAEVVRVEAGDPLVMIVTAGQVRIDREDDGLAEFALARRGQSLYVSAGEPIELSGRGEVFIGTVGAQ